jgi:hypothetical protein
MNEDEKAKLVEFAVKLGQVFDRPLHEFPNQAAFTSARVLYRDQPALFAQVYQALLTGLPPAVVHSKFPVQYDAVLQVRRMFPELLHAGRQQIIHNLEEASLLFSHRLVDEGATLGIDKVAQNLAILLEKHALLTGGVTSRQEHISAPKPEDLKAMFDALPSADPESIPNMQ